MLFLECRRCVGFWVWCAFRHKVEGAVGHSHDSTARIGRFPRPGLSGRAVDDPPCDGAAVWGKAVQAGSLARHIPTHILGRLFYGSRQQRLATANAPFVISRSRVQFPPLAPLTRGGYDERRHQIGTAGAYLVPTLRVALLRLCSPNSAKLGGERPQRIIISPTKARA
jgi:hypothetical protein